MAAAVGLPTLGLGLFVSVLGNPLSGLFVVAASLCVLAGVGGSIDGWMRREELPAGYMRLLVEVGVWQLGVALMLVVVGYLRSPMRVRWPALAFEDHLGVDTDIRWPNLKALSAGGLCALVGAGLGVLLIRNHETGQVLGSLFVAFAAGGFFAQLVFPQSNPGPVLFAPAVVAMGSYGYLLWNYHSQEAVIRAYFEQGLPGLALALPVHYVSAGLTGCTIGMGIAQGMEASSRRSSEEVGATG
jgi:hypothetical protein